MIQIFLLVASLMLGHIESFSLFNEKQIVEDYSFECCPLYYGMQIFLDNGGYRYPVYDDDESSLFTNAVTIVKDYEYDFCFNDRNDIDYFKCYINAGDILSISCDIYNDIDIFKYDGTDYVFYMSETYNQGDKIVFDSDCYFYFKVKGPGNYTGYYSFELISYDTVDYVTNYDYVRVKFNNNNIKSAKLLHFNDLSNLPNNASKGGYCGYYNYNSFEYNYSGYQSLQAFAQSNNLNYIPQQGGYGVFNENNIATGLPSDDQRKMFSFLTYPASSMLYAEPYFYSTPQSFIYPGSAFFVDDNYAFSAAHMAFYLESFSFCNKFNLSTSKHLTNTMYSYTINCEELIIPYAFIYYAINTNYSRDYLRYYDWSILKLNTDSIPSTYSHSYLGVQYPINTSNMFYHMGYPGYTYLYENNQSLSDSEFTKKKVLAGSSGDVYVDNDVIKTYMDITLGHSGGPCLFINNGEPFVTGIMSGNNCDGMGNIFSPINKYNYRLLNKYILGDI